MSYQLTQRDLDALRSYAEEHGRRWKSDLSADWYHARAIGMRGAILHGLRNNLGPEWLTRFQFAEPIAFKPASKPQRARLMR
jgi:hypothetical protein